MSFRENENATLCVKCLVSIFFSVNAVKWQKQGVGWRCAEDGGVGVGCHGKVPCFRTPRCSLVSPSPPRPPHRGSCFSFSPHSVWPRLPKQMGLFWRSGDPWARPSLSAVSQVNILSLTKTLHGKPSLCIWLLTNHILLQHVDQSHGAALLNTQEDSGQFDYDWQ